MPYAAQYPHDLHGNITAMPHLSGGITYSPFDQMVKADNASQDTYFTYGADGQRVRKVFDTRANLLKERIYLGSYEIYRERTLTPTPAVHLERHTLHIMDGVRRVAMVETKTIASGVPVTSPVNLVRVQYTNHLGSAHLECDETGAVISYEEMHAYGTSAYRSAASASEVSARRYRYTGKERDEETGLDYFGSRYYAPWLGRWTTADPLGLRAGSNLFLYCRAGPINFVDPNGNEPFFLGGVQPGGPLRAWKANADAFARWAQESSEKKAVRMENRRAEIREEVEQAGGGIHPSLVGGLERFTAGVALSVRHAPGTFFDFVRSTRAVVLAPTAEEALRSSGPIQSLDAAKAAAKSGDTSGAVENVLNFGLQTLGLAKLASSIPSVDLDGGAVSPGLALADGGSAAVVGGPMSATATGGSLVGGIFGGWISLATDVGDVASPKVGTKERAQELQKQIEKEAGVHPMRAEQIPVAVTDPDVPGSPRIVTFGDLTIHNLFASGKLKLQPGEELGYAPEFRGGSLKPESHVEGLGARTARDRYGATGGRIGSVPIQCQVCDGMMQGTGWVHTNPRRR